MCRLLLVLWPTRRMEEKTGGSSCSRVDCTWGGWSEWSDCRRHCGSSGTKSRSRGISRSSSCGGSSCSGPSKQTQACNRFCDNGGIPHNGYGGNCTDEVWGMFCDKRKYGNSSSMDGSRGYPSYAFILARFFHQIRIIC